MASYYWQHISRFIFVILNGIFIILVIHFFIIEIGRVDGQSMEPILRDNQLFIVNKLKSFLITPKRFDLIQLFHPFDSKKPIIKRVIGLPGEIVIFKKNSIFIKSKGGREFKLEEPYIPPGSVVTVESWQPYEFSVPVNFYFVVGDNRIFSTDSRDYGPVGRSRITGIVIPLFQ